MRHESLTPPPSEAAAEPAPASPSRDSAKHAAAAMPAPPSGDHAAPAPPAPSRDPAAAGPGSAERGGSIELLRAEIVEEIVAMMRYGTSSGLGAPVEPVASEVFDRLADGRERLSMAELLEAHHSLKLLIAPATPSGIRIYCKMHGGRARFLGPHATIRRLSAANLMFMLLFFGTSLSTLVNSQTIHLSVYEQSGLPLLFKLLFITAVAGIGASFAVLFEAWEDIRQRRFDPVMESSYWLQIGLGVVAGIILTEIVQTGAPAEGESSIKEPLVALAGGFSAGLLHVVLSRVVKAIRHIFEPADPK